MDWATAFAVMAMLHSLRWRVLLTMGLLVLVALGTVALLASRATTTEFQRYIAHGRVDRNVRLETMLNRYYNADRSWDGVQPMLQQMGEISGEWIALADSTGLVIASSDSSYQGKSVGHNWPPPSGRITYRGTPIASVYVSPEGSQPGLNTERGFVSAVNRWLLLATLLAGLAAVLLTWGLTRRVLGPVEALTKAALEMEKGDLTQRVDVHAQDEIGKLAGAFNAMAGSLARQEQLRRNMVSDVAHELRTPLAGIRGYVEAFRDGVIEPDEAALSSLHEETMLLNRLVDDLQELAMAEAGQLKLERAPMAVADVAAQVVQVLQAQAAAKRIHLVSQVSAGLPLVSADPHRISQVLRNLLVNALAYTAEGGSIAVTGLSDDEFVETTVRDTGTGIAPQHLPFVFDRFYRADRSRTRSTGGAGLGLAIVKQWVEAHGGRVWVDSTVGVGSSFHFTLPVAGAMDQPPSASAD
jgi:signal transduction histidine kinase